MMARGQAGRQRWQQRRHLALLFLCLFECAPHCTLLQQRNQTSPAKPGNASQGGSLRRVAQLQMEPAASTARGYVTRAANGRGPNPANRTHMHRNRKMHSEQERSAPGTQATRTAAQLLYSSRADRKSHHPGTHGPAQPEHIDTSQTKPKGTTAAPVAQGGGGVSGVHVTQAVQTPAVLHWPDFLKKTSARRARAVVTLR